MLFYYFMFEFLCHLLVLMFCMYLTICYIFVDIIFNGKATEIVFTDNLLKAHK